MEESPDLATRPELQGLPISQLLVRRLQAVTDEENNYLAEDAIPPIVAAISSLEKEFRAAELSHRQSAEQRDSPRSSTPRRSSRAT